MRRKPGRLAAPTGGTRVLFWGPGKFSSMAFAFILEAMASQSFKPGYSYISSTSHHAKV